MLPAERRREMARLIKNKGAVNTRELAEALGISTMTVRRDLKVLEERNQLELTWGGAVPFNFEANDIPRARKAVSMLDAKLAIARAASLYIKSEDFIALDAGTTSLELARLLPTLPLTSLGVVTPDLEIALLLSGCEHISVFLSGGLIDPVSRACNDSDAVAYLRGLRLTMAFVGTNVWDIHHGVTTSTPAKTHYKRQLVASADKTFLLADSSKYAKFSPWLVAELQRFDHIITDGGLPAEAQAALNDAGARLCVAN